MSSKGSWACNFLSSKLGCIFWGDSCSLHWLGISIHFALRACLNSCFLFCWQITLHFPPAFATCFRPGWSEECHQTNHAQWKGPVSGKWWIVLSFPETGCFWSCSLCIFHDLGMVTDKSESWGPRVFPRKMRHLRGPGQKFVCVVWLKCYTTPTCYTILLPLLWRMPYDVPLVHSFSILFFGRCKVASPPFLFIII